MQINFNSLLTHNASGMLLRWFLDRFSDGHVSFNNLVRLANAQRRTDFIDELYRIYKQSGRVNEVANGKIWSERKYVNGVNVWEGR